MSLFPDPLAGLTIRGLTLEIKNEDGGVGDGWYTVGPRVFPE